MGRKQREKLLQFVDDLVAQSVAVLTGSPLRLDEESARQAGQEITRRMCAQYGKSYMYVPTARDFELDDRDREIWAKYGQDGADGARRYTRDRVDQLAEEYGVTPQQIYNIVRLQQHIELLSRQAPLPGIEPAQNPR